MPDRNGYPTDDELAKIRAWPITDPSGWLAFVKECWWAADWGWHEEKGIYHMSTGGWSGNEEIMSTMEESPLWAMTYHGVRRGGHYLFALPGIVPTGEQP